MHSPKQMLHRKHKQHRHRRSKKVFHWSAKSTFCLPISGCWRYNVNGRSHKALPFLHHKENDPCYCNSPKNPLRWPQGFFSHRIKVHDILHSAVIVSLHYLPQIAELEHHKIADLEHLRSVYSVRYFLGFNTYGLWNNIIFWQNIQEIWSNKGKKTLSFKLDNY